MTPKARLLIVDDDEPTREVLRRRLVRSGYEVDAAEDGSEALALVRSRPYDLVLLDNMMPGLSGPQVLQRIRETWSPTELPVIMVTALDDREHTATAMREGANDYLSKPLDFSTGLARIETQLGMAAEARENRLSKELYRLAFRASDDGLWEWDIRAGIIQCSPVWVSMLGYPETHTCCSWEEWLHRAHPEDRTYLGQRLEAILRDGGTIDCEYRVRREDGQYLWAEIRARVLRNAAGEPVRISGYQTDITVRKTVDPLTALPNRFWLSGEIREAAVAGRGPVLLLIDIDEFDRIEQSLAGGTPGRLLTAVAAKLRARLNGIQAGQDAVLARTGEHQFGLLLRYTTDPSDGDKLAEALHKALRQPLAVGGEDLFATASIGIAQITSGLSEEETFRNAGAALRRARDLGGSRSETFHERLRRDEIAETRLENDLRHALERSEFDVHYQPKVHLLTGEIIGVEALVRWDRPGHGLVRPDLFIPAAERTGLVVPMGNWVLDRACRDIVELRRTYPDLSVSVNVSGRQLAETDLVNVIGASLESAGLEPSALNLEITETFLVEDPEAALTKLGCIRSMGVGLKLDDFGSGYSSLKYLQRFPFDTIKIDRSFVARLTASRESAEIMRAIVGLAHSLRMSVIAEGIETRDQLVWLRELGCTFGQGYLFSRPVPLPELKLLLTEWPKRLCFIARDGDWPIDSGAMRVTEHAAHHSRETSRLLAPDLERDTRTESL